VIGYSINSATLSNFVKPLNYYNSTIRSCCQGLVDRWASGLGDWWERERQEAVGMCKSAKVNVCGLVVGWAGGMGVEEEARGGGKVQRWTGRIRGLGDQWTGGGV
jgi:hypothetical protein